MGFRQRIVILGIVDILIITLAIVLAYFLRFDFKISPKYFSLLPYVVIMNTVLVLTSFVWVKLYRRVWQYASIGELFSIIKAVSVSEFIFFVIHFSLQRIEPMFVVPRSIYILSWAFIILGIGGSRFAWRMFRDGYFKIQPHHRRTLIIGAGDAGALIAKELKHSPDTDCYPVAFIDDDPTKKLLEVLGLPIVGSREDILEVVKVYKIQEIIIALPSVPKSEIAEIINICKETMANIRILPKVSDLVNGKVSIKMIRDVKVEDLLGREPVEVDLKGIADYVTNQMVLVTGAGGSIGSELCRQIAPFSPGKLLLLGHGENSIYEIELELRRLYPELELETVIADIQDLQRLKEIFAFYRPNVIFHAAAHKHVPLMERNPIEAIKNNVFGTKNVAECAKAYGASHFVMISTDKAVNPTSVMGTTKRIAEMIIQSMEKVGDTKFVAVRFGNVLGSRGSVIPVFKQQIEYGGPVTVTHSDMVRYFMTIPEAVQLVIQAGALARGGEIFILDMGKPVRIADLARDLIRLSGLEPDKDIKILYTGIRPGEKLFEEILTAEEGTAATKHNRIFVEKPLNFSKEDLTFAIRKLEQMIIRKDEFTTAFEIKSFLSQIVPTYRWKTENESSERETLKQELLRARIESAAGKD